MTVPIVKILRFDLQGKKDVRKRDFSKLKIWPSIFTVGPYQKSMMDLSADNYFHRKIFIIDVC